MTTEGRSKVYTKDTAPKNWQRWRSDLSGAKQLGTTAAKFRSVVRELDIVSHEFPDGTRRYEPEDFTMVVETFERERANREERISSTDQVGVELAKQGLQHTRQMVEMFLVPIREVVGLLKDELTETRSLVRKYETDYREMLLKQAEAEADKEDREIVHEQFKSETANRDKAWSVILDRLPQIVDGAMAGLVDSDDAKKVKATIELLKTLDPSVLKIVFESGMLSEKQRELARTILGDQAPKPDAKSNGKQEESDHG